MDNSQQLALATEKAAAAEFDCLCIRNNKNGHYMITGETRNSQGLIELMQHKVVKATPELIELWGKLNGILSRE